MKNKIKKVTVYGMELEVDFDYSCEEFYFNKILYDGEDVSNETTDSMLDKIKSKLLEDLNVNR